MSTMQKLTLLHLKRNRVRTVVTVIGIILSAALMTVVTGVVSSGRQTLIDTAINQSGDWTIALNGAFNEDSAKELSQHRSVQAVYEQAPVGVAKFDSKSAYKPFVKLTGMSENSFESCHPCTLAEGHYPKAADEILLTPQFLKYSNKTYHEGDKITLGVGGRWAKNSVDKNDLPKYNSREWLETYLGEHHIYDPENEDFITEFTKTYTVSGILQTAEGDLESDSSANAIKLFTGLTYDKTQRSASYSDAADMQLRLFDNEEAAYTRVLSELTGLSEEDVNAYFNGNPRTEDEIGAMLEKLSHNRFGITGFNYNHDVLRFRAFAVSEQTMNILTGIAVVVMVIIILSGIFIIRNSFAISITEKTRLYGMLSSVGATPRQIRRNVLFEGFLLGAAGIPLGVGLGIGVTAFLTVICNALLKEGLNGNRIAFCISWIGVAIAIVLSALTIFLSTIFTAIRASKIAPVDAIRGNKDVKTGRKKAYKTPKLIEKLFGVGGSIAYKNLKRSRKKYRATVVSIVASVALFLSVFSLVGYTFYYVGDAAQPTEFNLDVHTPGSENAYKDAEQIVDTIKRLDNIESMTEQYQSYGAELRLNKSDIPEDMLQPGVETTLYGNAGDWIDRKRVTCQTYQLMALDDESYRDILAACGVDYETAKDKALINNRNEILTDGFPSNKSGKLLKNPAGTEVELVYRFNENEDTVLPLTIIGDLSGIEGVSRYNETGVFYPGTILVSLEWMKNNMPDDLYSIGAETFIKSSDPDRTEQDISDLMGDVVSVYNYERQVRMMNAVTLVIQIFVYGFILVISLIGMTNIFNTISSNMRLRAREFASLRSVGMTKREFNRMIRLESVFYSVKSLLIGIPLGLLGGYIIKLMYSQYRDIPYQFPWPAILISIAAVGLVVWVIMRYSIAKVRKQNIIETIRNENI
ncbi:MAG: FtsX-like permease family protein [Ruminococcus sp.]|nr:FtsX-like permease family protein [Ruminococcus sp.]